MNEPINKQQDVKRGQIYFIKDDPYRTPIGSESWANRPAVIVSNNINNKYSNVVSVVFLTTAKKKSAPTHVTVISNGKHATAMCEQIHPVDKQRLGDLMGECTSEEMTNISNGMQFALAIASNNSRITGVMKKWESYIKRYNLFGDDKPLHDENKIRNLIEERDCYKKLYELQMHKNV